MGCLVETVKVNLNSGTRTITLNSTGGTPTFSTVLGASGGSSVLRLNAVGTNTSATVQNGSLFIDGSGVSTLVGVQLGAIVNFANNAALEIGSKTLVFASTSTTGKFGTGVNAPALTLDSGSYFSMSSATASANQEIYSLAGAGSVTNFNPSSTATGTLTINHGNGATFSGTISDGAALNATTGLTATGTVAVIKTGAEIQTFSGNNTYSGGTTLSGGSLQIGSASSGSVGNITSSAIGTGTLTFNGGGISSSSTTARTLYNAIVLGADATLGDSTNNGKLTFAGDGVINSGAKNLTLNSDARFDGNLSSTGSLIKTGTGVLTLGGSSTFSGGFTLKAGTALLAANTAGAITSGPIGTAATLLGNATGTQNATLLIDGAYTIANNIRVQSGSSSNVLTLGGNADANSIFSGTITIGTNSTVAHDVTFKSTTTGANSITFSGTIIDGSTLTSVGNVLIDGGGTVAFTNVGNTYGGSTTIQNGTTLSVTKLAAGSSNSSVGNSSGVAANLVLNNGTLLYAGSGDTSNRAFTVGVGGGTINGSGTGPLTLTGTGLAFSGTGNRTLTLSGSTGGSLAGVIAVPSSGATSLGKAGNGTWIVSGASSFTGGTSVAAGTLKLGNASALGASAGAVGVAGGAALDLGGQAVSNTNPLTLNGTGISSGGALTNSSTTASSYAGLVTLGSDSSVIASAGNITISNAGTILGSGFGLTVGGAKNTVINSIIGTGAGSVTKQDGGVLTLAGANTYTGGTTINGGTLQIGTTSTLSGATVGSTIVSSPTGNGDVTFASGTSIDNTATSNLWYANTITFGNTTNLVSTNRLRITAKTFDLASTTKTLNVNGKSVTVNGNLLTGEGTGISQVEFADTALLGNGTPLFQNGTLDLETTTFSGSNYGAMRFSNSVTFNNADLKVGGNVLLFAANANVLGTSAATTPNVTVDGILDFAGKSVSVKSLAGSGAVYNSMLSANSTAVTLALLGTTGSTTFSGSISDGPGTGALSLSKSAGSTQILTGPNAYTGATSVTGGVLSIATAGSINTTSGVVINGGEFNYSSSAALTKPITFTKGTISGTGTVTAVTAGANDFVRPGATSAAGDIGVLSTGNFALNVGSKLAVDVDLSTLSTNPALTHGEYTSDTVNVTGSVALGGALELNLVGNPIGSVNKTVVLILNDDVDAITNPVFSSIIPTNAAGISYTLYTTYNAATGLTTGGNDVAINFSQVPEPTSLSMMALAAGGLLARRRRRK